MMPDLYLTRMRFEDARDLAWGQIPLAEPGTYVRIPVFNYVFDFLRASRSILRVMNILVDTNSCIKERL